MLFREEDDHLLAFTQPAHAWLSGQMAQAWGNAQFRRPEPHAEVCLAAALHDIAWLPWEQAPSWNADSGLPHDFRELPFAQHARLWQAGVEQACAAYGAYVALLVSRHADTLHGRKTPADPARAQALQAFLDEQHRVQDRLVASLRDDVLRRDAVTPEGIERNRLLIDAVDRLSLALCWGVRDEVRLDDISPHGGERLSLRLRALHGRPDAVVVDPWPFAGDHLELACEARRLPRRFGTEAAMREALARPDNRVTVLTRLMPELPD